MASIRKPLKKALFFATSIAGMVFMINANPEAKEGDLVALGEKAEKLFNQGVSGAVLINVAKADVPVSCSSDGDGAGDGDDDDDGGDGP